MTLTLNDTCSLEIQNLQLFAYRSAETVEGLRLSYNYVDCIIMKMRHHPVVLSEVNPNMSTRSCALGTASEDIVGSIFGMSGTVH